MAPPVVAADPATDSWTARAARTIGSRAFLSRPASRWSRSSPGCGRCSSAAASLDHHLRRRRLLLGSSSLLAGRVPYKDFLLLHPPGVMVVLAPFAELGRLTSDSFGMTVARLAVMALGALTAVLVYVVGRRVDPVIERQAAGVPFRWVAADSVYGVGDIERDLRHLGKGYVLGVGSTHVFRSWGRKRLVAGTAAEIANTLDHRIGSVCREGRHEIQRLHDWCYLELAHLDADESRSKPWPVDARFAATAEHRRW